jgi:hypothetical protein
MKYFAIIILLLAFAFPQTLLSQETEPETPWFVSLNYRTGENRPHRPIIKNLTYPYRGVEAKLGWQSIGKQPWQIAYRYPSYGIGFNWSTFKTDVLGEPFALYFFTNFPQVSTQYWRLDLEVDLGFSYGINPYHEEKNPQNFATGSSGNAFFGIYLENNFYIEDHFSVFASGGLTHYSNGAMGWPNLGLNIPSLKFGVRYQPNFKKHLTHSEKPSYSKHWAIVTFLASGKKTLFAPVPIFREYLINTSLYYRTSYKRRIGITYELVYNEAITGVWTRRDESGKELLTQAVFVSHEFLINRFTVLTQFGLYVSNLPFDKDTYNRFQKDSYLSRLGIGYYITPWSRFSLSLKSHYIKAEYVELGLIFDLQF